MGVWLYLFSFCVVVLLGEQLFRDVAYWINCSHASSALEGLEDSFVRFDSRDWGGKFVDFGVCASKLFISIIIVLVF